jgi:dihydrolipoamide dehydrogenase
VETTKEYDLLVIGAGPGGYVAAIRGAQLGLRVGVVERKTVGGVCLNEGCIPSKALIRNAEVLALFKRRAEFGISCDNLKADFGVAVERSQKAVKRLTKGVEFLFKKNRVDLIKATGRLVASGKVQVKGEDGKERRVVAKKIILATGTRVRSLPGVEIDRSDILTSDEALLLKRLPKSFLIIGGGATGVEFAYVFAVYGVEVTLVELMPRLLPTEDHEISEHLEGAFKKLGIRVLTATRVEGVKRDGKQLTVALKSERKGEKASDLLEVEKILVAAGRQANVEDLGLEGVGVKLEKGFVRTDEHLETTASGTYAIGDVAGKALLAHSAMAEGVYVAERIAGRNPVPLDYQNVPNCVYCQPQVARVGWTEEEARKSGREIRIGRFPFQANGKALALGETEGFVKIVADTKYGEILGVHMIGAEVTELIGEATLARFVEATAFEVKGTIHPHPTLSEAVMEAAGAVCGEAIHI